MSFLLTTNTEYVRWLYNKGCAIAITKSVTVSKPVSSCSEDSIDKQHVIIKQTKQENQNHNMEINVQ